MNLFYLPDLKCKIGDLVKLSGDEAHHIDRVLRLDATDKLLLSNGNGNWAIGKIRNTSKKLVEVEILEIGFLESDQYKIAVAQALTKSDRAKEAVELLTESGVYEIYPWISKHSIGKDCSKWRVHSVEAGKQSRRFWLPKIYEPSTLSKIISIAEGYEQVIVCHESATESISKTVKPAKNTLIVIGPEGGLASEEIDLLVEKGAKVVKLGKPILRSAHAGIAAVSAVSVLIGNW